MPSPWVSAALNRRALRSSFTNRPFGFAVANRSVPSITILISRPARRSRAGTDRSCRSYFTRLVRLSYLAPDITQAILNGWQPPDLTPEKLLERRAANRVL
jgi:hypothetical protein